MFGEFIVEHRNRLVIVNVVLTKKAPHCDFVVILDEVVGVDEEGGTVDGFAVVDEVTIVGGTPANGHPG